MTLFAVLPTRRAGGAPEVLRLSFVIRCGVMHLKTGQGFRVPGTELR